LTPPQRSRYYILPKDDPLKAVNILRTAAGLDPLREDDGTAQRAGVSGNRPLDET